MTAQTIATAVAGITGAQAITYSGGYAIIDGKTVRFPPAKTLKERRNEKGRVTYALCEFPDRSRGEFKYSENKGASFQVAR